MVGELKLERTLLGYAWSLDPEVPRSLDPELPRLSVLGPFLLSYLIRELCSRSRIGFDHRKGTVAYKDYMLKTWTPYARGIGLKRLPLLF